MEAEALILAGGKSTRMGGVHKGNLKIGEDTFLEHLVKEMRKEVGKIWISYGEKVHRRETDICEIVLDEYIGCGPIGGLHAALKKCGGSVIFVAACDMPFLQIELFRYLEQFLSREQDAIVPVTEGKVHPLAAIYRKRILPVLKEQIEDRDYKMMHVLDRIKVRYVDVSDHPEFCRMLRNINTTEAYNELLTSGTNEDGPV